jgi:hypothetical protein
MAQQKETRFKLKVMHKLDELEGIWYEKIQQLAKRGTPDLLICYRGKFFAWELKVAGGTVSKLQSYTLGKISEAGGKARIVTPETLGEALLELKLA